MIELKSRTWNSTCQDCFFCLTLLKQNCCGFFFPPSHFSEYFVFPEWIWFYFPHLFIRSWGAELPTASSILNILPCEVSAMLHCWSVSYFYSLEPLRSCVEGAGILLNCMSYIYEKLKGLWGFPFLVSNLLTALWGRECEVLSPFCRCYNRGIAQLDVGPIANHRLSGKCLQVFSTSISVI